MNTVSVTSVARDFVRMASQLFESMAGGARGPESVRHPTPGQANRCGRMLEKVLGLQTLINGVFHGSNMVASALVDLEFHDGAAPVDPMAKQAQVLADSLVCPTPDTHAPRTPAVSHVFRRCYSSGYFTAIMCSEVMDADAFAPLKKAGSAY